LKPILQALLLADHVYHDSSTGKFVIAGIFNRVTVLRNGVSQNGDQEEQGLEGTLKRPVAEIQQAGNPWVYISLTDVKGTVPLQIRYESLSGDNVMFTANFNAVSDDPLKTVELAFLMPALPRIIGVYSLELLYESESLGSHRVTVAELKNGGD